MIKGGSIAPRQADHHDRWISLMTQPGDSPKSDSAHEVTVPRDVVGDTVDRLSYAIGLGTVLFILIAIPALLWPHELGRYFTGYTYILVVVIAYFCVPFARRYMPRIKPRIMGR